ncbi:CHASE2 domain-containing protein [Pseudorhodoferax soli]|uniref:CHASE2 domain-containing protein n=1 Tax=Pseudorhodoferax soli TaxID=545864 RepID=A0A368XR99_9BURK|nr:CHASE2 domain-containing protein [Pseudorhodoferax soli]RCW70405.1 CHASE2 domain-containing protein [Pseudorhodoferax soli]
MSGSPRAHPAQAGKPWTGRGFAVLHHALAAGVMASAMLGMEHFHALDWLDAVMLQVVTPRSAQPASARPANLPQLLLIDEPTYADTFDLQSPLKRDKLAQVVGDALAAKPAVLLIDLQLEPSVGEPAERPLDDLLRNAKAAGTRVVLPLPEARTPELDRQAIAWMRGLCKAQVHFGLAQVRSHFGTVVRFDADPATMARLGTGDGAANPLCEAAALTQDLPAVWQMFASPSRSMGTSAPLHPDAVRAVVQQAIPWRAQSARLQLQQLRPTVIVLGGAYDNRDSFLTSAMDRAVPGAAIHASTIASEGAVTSSHAAGWLLDLGLGTLLGFLFEALWKLVRRIRTCSDRLTLRFVLLAWLRVAAASGIWLLAIGVALGLMATMGRLVECGMWLNPGPVVLGMLLHALLLKDSTATHDPVSWREYTHHSPSWPLQAACVAAALAYLMSH